MENLQPNDIIVKGTEERTVIDTSRSGKLVCSMIEKIKSNGHLAVATSELTWFTVDSLICDGWTKKEAPWKPKVGEEVWYVPHTITSDVFSDEFDNESYDIRSIEFNLIFPTRELAEARRNEISNFLKNN